MHSFYYDGRAYRSLRVCCAELGISYSKAVRLCRFYVRARKDPAVAVAWCMKGSVPILEQKTSVYEREIEDNYLRQSRHRDRMQSIVMNAYTRTPS